MLSVWANLPKIMIWLIIRRFKKKIVLRFENPCISPSFSEWVTSFMNDSLIVLMTPSINPSNDCFGPASSMIWLCWRSSFLSLSLDFFHNNEINTLTTVYKKGFWAEWDVKLWALVKCNRHNCRENRLHFKLIFWQSLL